MRETAGLNRLEKSLRILRELNQARLERSSDVARLEAVLRQHDYDAHDKVDSRQLTIFESL